MHFWKWKPICILSYQNRMSSLHINIFLSLYRYLIEPNRTKSGLKVMNSVCSVQVSHVRDRIFIHWILSMMCRFSVRIDFLPSSRKVRHPYRISMRLSRNGVERAESEDARISDACVAYKSMERVVRTESEGKTRLGKSQTSPAITCCTQPLVARLSKFFTPRRAILP